MRNYQQELHNSPNFRREGTLAHHKSAWRQWNSWCDIQHIDPFGASLSKVLPYLGVRFGKGLEYRTINVNPSAISSKHALVDGVPVGQHPKVCALLSGVFIKRPPQPKYCVVWDIQQVLGYVRNNWPNNHFVSKRFDTETTFLIV